MVGNHDWEGAEYWVRVESSLSDSKGGEPQKEEEDMFETESSSGRLSSSPSCVRASGKLLKTLMEDPDVLA